MYNATTSNSVHPSTFLCFGYNRAMSLRILVACPACKRQYDATGHETGAKFHCSCGAEVVVPKATPHDAVVVRCSSCGAPREKEKSACSFCASDFTLHEQDMHTICPTCMTRVSDRGRYCHHCASPVQPSGALGTPTKHDCPACGAGIHLTSRDLGLEGLSVLECESCAGLWLAHEALRHLIERSRQSAAGKDPSVLGAPTATVAGDAARPANSPMYRKCVACGQLMLRRNYGKKSGIIIDSCREHGIWFDSNELAHILRWVREGGHAMDQPETKLTGPQSAENRARLPMQRSLFDDQRKGGLLGNLAGILLMVGADILFD